MRGLFVSMIAIAACQGTGRAPTATPVVSQQPAVVAQPEDTSDVVRTTTSPAMTATYRATRMTQLTYALDCLAQIVPCSREAFAPAWKDGWTDDDTKALDDWRALRMRTGGALPGERVPPSSLPLPYRALDKKTALRVAGFEATDAADLAARMTALAPDDDIAEARLIVERFVDPGP